MKRIFIILGSLLLAGFVVCVSVGMILPCGIEVPSKAVGMYKFCTGLEYFSLFLPAMIFTSFVISLSVYFGQNSQGSTRSFSAAMGERFKYIMIVGLVCTFLLTVSNEVLNLSAKKKKSSIVNKPKIISEYIDVGNALIDKGFSERALAYANAALNLNPNSAEARDLKSRADIEINRVYADNIRFDLSNMQPLVETEVPLNIDPEKMNDSYNCYLMAKSAYDKQEWFNAHYYAQQGIKIGAPKDPNLDAMRVLSADAWNNITQLHKELDSEEFVIYDQKYKGYLALVNKDNLQAYYTFRYLYENYSELQRDPDVIFYLDVAMKRIEQEYFFVDETFELETFETANDVYFNFTHIDGSRDIVYFKGTTAVKETGLAIQYIRDLTIVSLNKYGSFVKKMTVPYAKMMPVSVKKLNSATKEMLEIDDKTDFVPYILLKSVDRFDSEIQFGPTYTYANGVTDSKPEYMIFPLRYVDFLMMEQSPNNPKTNSLSNLVKFIDTASEYGYSEEYFGQILLNRLLYPLFILFILIVLASLAWDNRLGSNQLFRLAWVWIVPLLLVIAYFAYQLLLVGFRLLNFVILGMTGGIVSVFAAAGIYIVMIIIASVFFLSRNSAS